MVLVQAGVLWAAAGVRARGWEQVYRRRMIRPAILQSHLISRRGGFSSERGASAVDDWLGVSVVERRALPHTVAEFAKSSWRPWCAAGVTAEEIGC